MAVVTMRELLDAGVHFGHQTRRWNPKMKRYILTDRNGIYIIDLQQTLTYIDEAFEFVKETVAHGGTILFVGTKKQAQEAVKNEAERVGMPYVNHRWLGGMLTNFQTVSKRLHRMKELQAMDEAEDGYKGRTKKEVLMLTRERTKLERVLGGIADMTRVPSALWIIDTNKEEIAVNEAHKLNIPVVAILDTNCDPDVVQYPIPGNDDAIRATGLLSKIISTAVEEGKKAREERELAKAREAAGDAEQQEETPTRGEGLSEPAVGTKANPQAAENAESAEADKAESAESAEDKATAAAADEAAQAGAEAAEANAAAVAADNAEASPENPGANPAPAEAE